MCVWSVSVVVRSLITTADIHLDKQFMAVEQ